MLFTLKKMTTRLAEPVVYSLGEEGNQIILNDYLGKPIKLTYTGKITCLACGRKTNKSFAQGYCYPCFLNSPETEECVLHPELCRAHEGIARNMEFAAEHCLQDHFVYLALSSDIKVGITRSTQIPTRWIDQGAWKAIKLAKVPNRFTSGLVEVALKSVMPDKTNWRKMLKNENADLDLLSAKQKATEYLVPELKQFVTEDNSITTIEYPVLKYPVKLNSLDFEKQSVISGVLTGIKGQYLMFDYENVINIRKFGGYEVDVDLA
jgi:hypothetical protein